jgi:hypothetical protein
MRRIKCAALSTAACLTIVAAGASAAAAKTSTLRFFSTQVYSRISDASGHPAVPPLAVGDRLSFGDNDYAGNHKHHAKQPTASDHVVCTVTSTSTSTALCDGTIAIGGSMIFGDDFVLNFISNAATTVKITGGTGRYRHAHGTIIVKPVGDNNDLTIKVSS